MERREEECIICHSPIIYNRIQRPMVCRICQKQFESNCECARGHYVCDDCHSKKGVETLRSRCLTMDSRNPVEIAITLMKSPKVNMHGPEHHVIVGSSLLTAYSNTVEDFDLASALEEMENRGKQVPGGICGMWGCCGAAVSCGIAYSIITETTPLSTRTWGLSNMLTSECLRDIAIHGGPRCCKRDSFTALRTSISFLRKYNDVFLETPSNVTCSFSHRNIQCVGKLCPFHSHHNTDNSGLGHQG